MHNTLSDADIITHRRKVNRGRRGFLGIMAFSGATGAMSALDGDGGQAQAQTTDTDRGAWTDAAGCGRGNGGLYTGQTDADNGNITDAWGYGRGMPYC
mgnify:FL=1